MKNIKTNIYISTTIKRFLSQIAIVEVYNGPENKSTSLRLLWNNGSQLSYITSRAQKLSLETTEKKIYSYNKLL